MRGAAQQGCGRPSNFERGQRPRKPCECSRTGSAFSRWSLGPSGSGSTGLDHTTPSHRGQPDNERPKAADTTWQDELPIPNTCDPQGGVQSRCCLTDGAYALMIGFPHNPICSVPTFQTTSPWRWAATPSHILEFPQRTAGVAAVASIAHLGHALQGPTLPFQRQAGEAVGVGSS